jgi:hypothetical protein
MNRLTPLLIPLGCFAAGCGPSAKDVIAERGPAARTQLAALTQVLDDCQALAPLDQDAVPAKVEGVVFADHNDRPDGNARTIWLQAQREPDKYLDPLDWSYRERDDWWRTTSQALSAQPPPFTEKHDVEKLKKAFDALAGTKYVLVIKTLEYKAPHWTTSPLYDAGSLRGEAHLYRLADGERLGGILFTAVGYTGVGGIGLGIDPRKPEAAVRSLTESLYANIQEFAEARLASRVAGVDSLYEIKEGGFMEPPAVFPRRR